MKGREEGREEGERGEGERGEKRGRGKEREREERNRREKGKDEEEGCNYGIVHNLGCSKETFKLQLSGVQSQSWTWKLMARNSQIF